MVLAAVCLLLAPYSWAFLPALVQGETTCGMSCCRRSGVCCCRKAAPDHGFGWRAAGCPPGCARHAVLPAAMAGLAVAADRTWSIAPDVERTAALAAPFSFFPLAYALSSRPPPACS